MDTLPFNHNKGAAVVAVGDHAAAWQRVPEIPAMFAIPAAIYRSAQGPESAPRSAF